MTDGPDHIHELREDLGDLGSDGFNGSDRPNRPDRSRRIKIKLMGRPAFWRPSMKGLNLSPPWPDPKYLSSCSSGNSSRGGSPSSNRRLREISSTRPLLTLRVFAFLNGLRNLRHSERSTSLLSPGNRRSCRSSKVRCSTSENLWSSAFKICAMDDTSQSRGLHRTCIRKAYASASRGYTFTATLLSGESSTSALLNLRVSVVFKKSRRRGKEKVS